MTVGGLVFVLLGCVAIGVGVYWVLIRPFALPLQKRIPTGKQYRASGAAPRKYPRYV